MKAVVVVAVLIVVLMVVVKDGRLFQKAGLTGGCTSIATPRGETGAWEKCTSGKLAGAPDLHRQGCRAVSFTPKTQLWACPEHIRSSPGS